MGFQRDDSLFSGFFLSLSTSPLSCYSLHLPDTPRPSLKSWSLACFWEPTLRHCPSEGVPERVSDRISRAWVLPPVGPPQTGHPLLGPIPQSASLGHLTAILPT